eukprot:NODE_2908_length_625_cov_8.095486_g2424_i0.p1 GENE.NODE_2908_length_625_cov_8.095486_g2424_i0~~NODE_2908_length_625_cov_8.095486_g2424_i0.p1  ORF type:complete len:184 (-),score=45.66 NODE_2908_length_625_cov_8.095486_g2424_i0:72-572(-)
MAVQLPKLLPPPAEECPNSNPDMSKKLARSDILSTVGWTVFMAFPYVCGRVMCGRLQMAPSENVGGIARHHRAAHSFGCKSVNFVHAAVGVVQALRVNHQLNDQCATPSPILTSHLPFELGYYIWDSFMDVYDGVHSNLSTVRIGFLLHHLVPLVAVPLGMARRWI